MSIDKKCLIRGVTNRGKVCGKGVRKRRVGVWALLVFHGSSKHY